MPSSSDVCPSTSRPKDIFTRNFEGSVIVPNDEAFHADDIVVIIYYYMDGYIHTHTYVYTHLHTRTPPPACQVNELMKRRQVQGPYTPCLFGKLC